MMPIVEEYSRECMALQTERSIAAEDVVETLAGLFAERGAPSVIRSDNGPEFMANAVKFGWRVLESKHSTSIVVIVAVYAQYSSRIHHPLVIRGMRACDTNPHGGHRLSAERIPQGVLRSFGIRYMIHT